MSQLSGYFPIAQAISTLFFPHVEIVIHDLKTGLIAAIYNPSSKRKVGDESLLDEINSNDELPDVFPVYSKVSWNGKKIKSISATLRSSNGTQIGLLCINLDLSKWEEMHQFLTTWINSFSEIQPSLLFKEDWREKINIYVSEYVKKEGISLEQMTKEKKKSLVLDLFNKGAFEAKNAASYIGEVLNLSRATIYNYLK